MNMKKSTTMKRMGIVIPANWIVDPCLRKAPAISLDARYLEECVERERGEESRNTLKRGVQRG